MQDFMKLENSIKKGSINKVYLIYGDQEYLKDVALNKITDYLLKDSGRDFNYDVFTDPVDFKLVVGSAEQLPVFAEKRLVVAKGPNLFGEKSSSGEEELLLYLENINPSTCLVFLTNKIDSRRKAVKLIKEKGETLHLTSPGSTQLAGWIHKQAKIRGKKIAPQAVDLLLATVGDNMLLLAQEVDKAALYGGEDLIGLEQLEQTLSKTTNLNVFKITELVTEKKGAAAVKLFQEMARIGEPPIKVLALLGRAFRQLLRAKLLTSGLYSGIDELCRELKVPLFVGRRLAVQQKHFSELQLCSALKIINEADWKIKTGQVDPVIAVEVLLHRLSGKKN